MTDFAGRILRPETGDWPIRSLMDNDFYKLTMGYFIFTFYRGTRVRFRFINRHKHIPVAAVVDEAELRASLDYARTLRYTRTDLAYLRGQNVYHDNMFSEEFLAFLANYQLPPYTLTRVGDQFEFTTEGNWEDVSPWETIFLAILDELFYRALLRTMSATELDIFFARASDKLYRKLQVIKKYPTMRFADFGFRRRFSHKWHQYCIGMAHEELGAQFTGASSTWMAFNMDLPPIGTNAHELPMVITALADTDDAKRDAQYEVLRKWERLFPKGGLRIVLPDTYGSRQFWKNMPQELAEDVVHNWRGERLDSGDPLEEAEHTIRRYAQFSIDPWKENKVTMPTDGNDVPLMVKIHLALEERIHHPFGWGTFFTNDTRGCHPDGERHVVINGRTLPITYDMAFQGHSFVAKPDEANGRPCVKLSNNTLKATGPKDEIEKYLRIFGHLGRGTQEVLV